MKFNQPCRFFVRPAFVLAFSVTPSAFAASLLSPSDVIRAIDSVAQSSSGFPGGEAPSNALDTPNAGTKYLNFGGAGSGIIVTPSGGAAAAQSFQLTTANDDPGRDPTSWQLFGTNAAIASASNSNGLGEAWTPIASGSVTLPAARLTVGTAVNFANSTTYTSYKLVFPTLNGSTLFQIADIALYTGTSAGGTNVFTTTSAALGIDNPSSASVYPGGEAPTFMIDGLGGNKYLNFGKENTGFIVQPASGLSVIDSFTLTTADDAAERDPASYKLFGATGPLLSADNSLGDAESWTLIQSGALSLPTDRNTTSGIISVSNSASYSLYRLEFDTLRDTGAANSMQIGEVQFFGTVVPEPTTALLGLLGVGTLAVRRRRA